MCLSLTLFSLFFFSIFGTVPEQVSWQYAVISWPTLKAGEILVELVNVDCQDSRWKWSAKASGRMKCWTRTNLTNHTVADTDRHHWQPLRGPVGFEDIILKINLDRFTLSTWHSFHACSSFRGQPKDYDAMIIPTTEALGISCVRCARWETEMEVMSP